MQGCHAHACVGMQSPRPRKRGRGTRVGVRRTEDPLVPRGGIEPSTRGFLAGSPGSQKQHDFESALDRGFDEPRETTCRSASWPSGASSGPEVAIAEGEGSDRRRAALEAALLVAANAGDAMTVARLVEMLHGLALFEAGNVVNLTTTRRR